MSYTSEETAIICGFLNLYFERDSVDVAVREKFRRFRRRAEQDALDREDYRWAEKALIFLQPYWWDSFEDQRALESVLLKTSTLSAK